EAARRVAKTAVPLEPIDRKIADLVRAEVPRLRDQLHPREHGVLLDRVEERRVLLVRTALAPEHRREIEAKPVDVHDLDPIAQRVHHEAQRGWAGEVE